MHYGKVWTWAGPQGQEGAGSLRRDDRKVERRLWGSGVQKAKEKGTWRWNPTLWEVREGLKVPTEFGGKKMPANFDGSLLTAVSLKSTSRSLRTQFMLVRNGAKRANFFQEAWLKGRLKNKQWLYIAWAEGIFLEIGGI